MSEHSYHKLYDRLVDEVKTLYYANQVRIHKGLWALIISTVLFLTIMFRHYLRLPLHIRLPSPLHLYQNLPFP